MYQNCVGCTGLAICYSGIGFGVSKRQIIHQNRLWYHYGYGSNRAKNGSVTYNFIHLILPKSTEIPKHSTIPLGVVKADGSLAYMPTSPPTGFAISHRHNEAGKTYDESSFRRQVMISYPYQRSLSVYLNKPLSIHLLLHPHEQSGRRH